MTSLRYAAEFSRPQMVKDYISILHIYHGQERVKAAVVEVNKPLYYKGYHFYQNTFGYDEFGPVSGIHVASAQGVWLVFAGYGLVFTGMVGRCWGKLRHRPGRPNVLHQEDPKNLTESANDH
jgi:hypothetical protein